MDGVCVCVCVCACVCVCVRERERQRQRQRDRQTHRHTDTERGTQRVSNVIYISLLNMIAYMHTALKPFYSAALPPPSYDEAMQGAPPERREFTK